MLTEIVDGGCRECPISNFLHNCNVRCNTISNNWEKSPGKQSKRRGHHPTIFHRSRAFPSYQWQSFYEIISASFFVLFRTFSIRSLARQITAYCSKRDKRSSMSYQRKKHLTRHLRFISIFSKYASARYRVVNRMVSIDIFWITLTALSKIFF